METKKNHCLLCNKTFIRKSNFDNHKIKCELKFKSKREKKIEDEENENVLTCKELTTLVFELMKKNEQLETKLNEIMKNGYIKKKIKIDVIKYLTNNVCPSFSYKEWINNHFKVLPQHFALLKEESLNSTLMIILKYNLTKDEDIIYPITCISKKKEKYYIYDNIEETETNELGWREMTDQEFSDMLFVLKMKMISIIMNVKKENIVLYETNDKYAITHDTCLKKFSEIKSLPNEATFNRIKQDLFDYLKIVYNDNES